ncbi:hypothetical protein [Phenylobacterium sp.]|uniref:hypothetical protein n=1 Tax=Phenylobacterium sp. TaxID=1871053 RepID=UPI002737B723|nr:hypothetical protein [Phenylobacterium sp.]MDP3868367.1 hypothetical protein [Phenylobacterium sp.]
MPLTYYIAVMLCGALLLIGVVRIKADWCIPYGAALATIAAWYFVEPIYTPEQFAFFVPGDISEAYLLVIVFLCGFALFTPVMVRTIAPPHVAAAARFGGGDANQLAIWAIAAWALILAYGTFRLSGDLMAALFPVNSRTGVQMWSRQAGAGAGPTGFIVSAAAYLYTLCTAAFGLLFFMVKGVRMRAILLLLIAISWPYFVLLGARSTFIAVCLPAVLSYALFARHPIWLKTIVVAGAGGVINLILLLIISYRNIGFGTASISKPEGAIHYGLNMSSELVHAVSFLREGTLKIDFGMGYLTQAVNVIPRAIWAGKPLGSVEYSIARGFGDPTFQDIGVTATVSTGIIGQGVLAFGPFFGPLVAAALFSAWVATLTRFWRQGTPTRFLLFLIGLGLTFNLGRDVSLLVLWPMIFAYTAVKLLEQTQANGMRRSNNAVTGTAALRRTWSRGKL